MHRPSRLAFTLAHVVASSRCEVVRPESRSEIGDDPAVSRGDTVRRPPSPAGLFRRAVEEHWEVDAKWPEFDEVRHTGGARKIKYAESSIDYDDFEYPF